MASRYVLKPSREQFMFVLKASNGEVILTSERYKTRDGAKNGIESVRVNSPNDSSYNREVSTNNQPYFNLIAANGLIIGTSEMYSSDAAREKGISSVKKNGPSASVDDQT